jgi:DNA-3-methyladenine glycosylase
MRLDANFYQQDVITVAKGLLGATLVRQYDDGQKLHLTITDVEVYNGEDDLACHASKGRTTRTEVMYQPGGKVYVYLIYGMYWLLNIVTGPEDHPQAVLIRGTREVNGPGRIGKILQHQAVCGLRHQWLITPLLLNRPELELSMPGLFGARLIGGLELVKFKE